MKQEIPSIVSIYSAQIKYKSTNSSPRCIIALVSRSKFTFADNECFALGCSTIKLANICPVVYTNLWLYESPITKPTGTSPSIIADENSDWTEDI